MKLEENSNTNIDKPQGQKAKVSELAILAFVLVLVITGCDEGDRQVKADGDWQFHTRPDKWAEPRIFHSSFNQRYSDRISISRVALADVNEPKEVSPNKAYWFSACYPDTVKPGPYDFRADIYNERDYLIRLKVSDVYGNYEQQIRWINEKLLYVKVWWGRVKGADFVIDVEREAVIHQEDVNRGAIPFQQWQQAKSNQDD